jgi:choline dehydrogenase
MGWARGHKNDWDFFASESGETAWNYESVLTVYRRMEDWQGAPDPKCRGTGGLVFVQSTPDPNRSRHGGRSAFHRDADLR